MGKWKKRAGGGASIYLDMAGKREPQFYWIQLGGGGGSFRLNTAKNGPSGFKSKHLNFFFRIC